MIAGQQHLYIKRSLEIRALMRWGDVLACSLDELCISPLNGEHSLLYKMSLAAAKRIFGYLYEARHHRAPSHLSLTLFRAKQALLYDGTSALIKSVKFGHALVSPVFLTRHNSHLQVYAPSDLFVMTSGASSRRANKVFSCSTMSLGDQIYGFWGDGL
ncbi:uncharacterized protein ARMOST_02633 [Armillaria ostoyae]|uniref:Uncharacterized protein n=1 Tax=Armillaria ostoyae TaxID=47428 RepID=A0A284QS92_ARMOS|nr:uncharacterized protein ARMOST_02633 [Armillaria ostoyae]